MSGAFRTGYHHGQLVWSIPITTTGKETGPLFIHFFLSWARAASGGINFQARQPGLHLGRVEHSGYLRAMLLVQKW